MSRVVRLHNCLVYLVLLDAVARAFFMILCEPNVEGAIIFSPLEG